MLAVFSVMNSSPPIWRLVLSSGHQREYLGLPPGQAKRCGWGGRRCGCRGRGGRLLKAEAAATGEQFDLAAQWPRPQRHRGLVGGPEHRLGSGPAAPWRRAAPRPAGSGRTRPRYRCSSRSQRSAARCHAPGRAVPPAGTIRPGPAPQSTPIQGSASAAVPGRPVIDVSRGDQRFGPPAGLVDAGGGPLGAGQLGAVGLRPQPQRTELEHQELEPRSRPSSPACSCSRTRMASIHGGACVVVAALPDGQLGQAGQRRKSPRTAPGSAARPAPGAGWAAWKSPRPTSSCPLIAVQREGSGRLSLQRLGEHPVAVLPVARARKSWRPGWRSGSSPSPAPARARGRPPARVGSRPAPPASGRSVPGRQPRLR